jgi:hypothetical protein
VGASTSSFTSGRVAVTSAETPRSTRPRRNSTFILRPSRLVIGDTVKVVLNTYSESEYDSGTVGHTPRVMPVVSGDLPQKHPCTNSGPEGTLVTECDGRDFLMLGPIRREDVCFDQTNQINSDIQHPSKLRPMKRKSSNCTCGPPAKRRRVEC